MKQLILLLFFFILKFNLFSQENPTIVSCNGEQYFCIVNSKFNMCANIKTDPLYNDIYKYWIVWGDGKIDTIKGNGKIAPPSQYHEYDLSKIDKCSKEISLTMKVYSTISANDDKPKNGSFDFFLRNKAVPDFSFSNIKSCVNVDLGIINNSCLVDKNKPIVWTFSDGTVNPTGKHSFSSPGIYTVKLEVESINSECGKSEITKQIEIIDKAEANIKADSGFTKVQNDTFVVCLNGATKIKLNGNISQNATEYEWTSKDISISSKQKDSSFIRLDILKAGFYQVTLIVNNDCKKPSEKTIYIKAIENLVLNHQVSSCIPIPYQPNPLIKEAKYYLDNVLTDFNTSKTLVVRDTPYIVRAELSNDCKPNQVLYDTIYVTAPSPVNIISPASDISVCVNSDTIKLVGQSITGGAIFEGTGVENIGKNYFFVPDTNGVFTITYVENKNTPCKQSKQITITVQGVSGTIDSITTCPKSIITLQSSLSGIWSSSDCPACIIDTLKGVFDASKAGNKTKVGVNLKVSNSLGCSGNINGNISIVYPKAEFKVIKACENQAVILDYLNTSGMEQDLFIDGVKVLDKKNIGNISKGKYLFSLVSTTLNCSDTASQEINITVQPQPMPFEMVKSSDCSPVTVTFKPLGVFLDDVTYIWDMGRNSNDFDTIRVPISQIYEAKNSKTTKFSIKSISTNTCGSFIIDSTLSIKIVPKAKIRIDPINTGCTPFEVVLTNQSEGDDFNLSWDLANGQIIDNVKDSIKVTYYTQPKKQSFFKPYITAKNECGPSSDTILITVNPPGVEAFFEADKYIICPGDSIKFIDSSTPKPTNVIFYFGDGNYSPLINPTHIFKGNSKGFYNVTLKAYGVCDTNSFDTINRVIEVREIPMVDISSNYATCEGQETIFKILTQSNIKNYEWYVSDGSVYKNAFDLKHKFNKGNKDYTVKLKVTDIYNCVNETTKSIFVKPKPDINFKLGFIQTLKSNCYDSELIKIEDTIQIPNICIGSLLHLSNNSKKNEKYEWEVWQNSNINDKKIYYEQSPKIGFIRTGYYNIKLKVNDNLCADSLTKSDVIEVIKCDSDSNVFIPNIFNLESINDLNQNFYVFTAPNTVENINLSIYDKWGEKIYDCPILPNKPVEWVGRFKECKDTNIYVYIARIKFKDGTIKCKYGDVKIF